MEQNLHKIMELQLTSVTSITVHREYGKVRIRMCLFLMLAGNGKQIRSAYSRGRKITAFYRASNVQAEITATPTLVY